MIHERYCANHDLNDQLLKSENECNRLHEAAFNVSSRYKIIKRLMHAIIPSHSKLILRIFSFEHKIKLLKTYLLYVVGIGKS